MIKSTKKLCAILLAACLLCVSSAGFASPATYTITDQELTELETVFAQLKSNNEALSKELAVSNVDLTTAQKQLIAYQSDLEKLQKQLEQLKSESAKAKQELTQASNSLTEANRYLDQYEKEVKAQIKSLSWQRNLLIVGIIAVAVRK